MSSRRLRILFDAHPLIGNKTGVGYFTSQLVGEMAARYPEHLEFIGFYHNFLHRKPPISALNGGNIRYVPITWLPGQVVNQLRRWHISIPIELLTLRRANFILFPNYLDRPSLFHTPSAAVIHDLTFVDHPETMSAKNLEDLRRYIPDVLKRSTFIITVSRFGKRRIHQVFGTSLSDIFVTHIPPPNPLPLSASTARQLLARQKITRKYILYIGTIEPRKNLENLLDAYALLEPEVRQQYSLVLAGKMDWKYAETQRKIKAMEKDGLNIIYTGYVDDQTRAALYHEASLFVFPAFYEGFGMPILEAMSYDTPCAISDIDVFREVAGQAAAYFDPYDVTSIASVLTAELSKPTVSSVTRRQQLKLFSWDSICPQLYKYIADAVERRH